jgi:hypothetical protein
LIFVSIIFGSVNDSIIKITTAQSAKKIPKVKNESRRIFEIFGYKLIAELIIPIRLESRSVKIDIYKHVRAFVNKRERKSCFEVISLRWYSLER